MYIIFGMVLMIHILWVILSKRTQPTARLYVQTKKKLNDSINLRTQKNHFPVLLKKI